jgi:hypothetical protein
MRAKLTEVLSTEKVEVKQLRRDALEVVRMLLEAGAKPDAGRRFRTPLSLGREVGDVAVARLRSTPAWTLAHPAGTAGRHSKKRHFKQPAVVKLMRGGR